MPGEAASAHVLVEEAAAEVVAGAAEAVPELRARVATHGRGASKVEEDRLGGGVGGGRGLEGICEKISKQLRGHDVYTERGEGVTQVQMDDVVREDAWI